MAAIRRHETPGSEAEEFVIHSNPSSMSFMMRIRQLDPVAPPPPSLTQVLRRGWRERLLYGQDGCYSKTPFPKLPFREEEVLGLGTSSGRWIRQGSSGSSHQGRGCDDNRHHILRCRWYTGERWGEEIIRISNYFNLFLKNICFAWLLSYIHILV